jgi:hypothetical protein
VVLVPVREQDSAQARASPREVFEVGHDGVDAGHLGAREHHAGVEQQEMLLPLQQHRVQAELAEPAERDQPQLVAAVQESTCAIRRGRSEPRK